MKPLYAITAAAALISFNAVAGPFADYNQGVLSNDVRIIGWATGWQDHIQPDQYSGGFFHNNNNQRDTIDNAVLGAPTDFTLNGTTKHGLALGHGGSIVLTFGRAIPNQPGWNFAVFNNAFLSGNATLAGRGGGTNLVYYQSGTNLVPVVRGYNFLWCKPAFVDVSSDAMNWARFPVTYLNTDLLFQANLDEKPGQWISQDPTLIDGLAGKVALQYGTPFSLTTLTNEPNVVDGLVDLNNIHYIRLTDVIGDGSRLDQYGNPIFSPYYTTNTVPPIPTPDPAATDGFVLRGVALLETVLPTINRVRLLPPNFLMDVSGLVSGQTYIVQSCTNLVVATWTNEMSFVARPSNNDDDEQRRQRDHQVLPGWG